VENLFESIKNETENSSLIAIGLIGICTPFQINGVQTDFVTN